MPGQADPAHDDELLLLRDGRQVRLRPWRDDDRDVDAAAVASLSPLSRHLRFLTPSRASPRRTSTTSATRAWTVASAGRREGTPPRAGAGGPGCATTVVAWR